MPPLTGSAAVIAACQANWEAHKTDCSGFVRAVAAALNITMTGLANDIVDQLQTSPWTLATNGVDAAAKATAGMFVIAGLKEDPHGHVVVVTPGPLAFNAYPTGYWGQLGGIGKENATINWAWTHADLPNVIYACRTF